MKIRQLTSAIINEINGNYKKNVRGSAYDMQLLILVRNDADGVRLIASRSHVEYRNREL